MSRDRTSKFQLMLVMAAILAFMGINLIGCEPTEGTLLLDTADEEGLNPDELETADFALTGAGLPNGCHGNEFFANMGRPHGHQWLWDNATQDWHFMVFYNVPLSLGGANLCWLSFHGTMNTNNYAGGSDNWQAVYQNGRIEVLIPGSLRLRYGYLTDSRFRNRFYMWSYWEM